MSTRVSASAIDLMASGTRIIIDSTEYVRMMDSKHEHIEGYILRLDNGWWGHWSRLLSYKDTVEVL